MSEIELSRGKKQNLGGKIDWEELQVRGQNFGENHLDINLSRKGRKSFGRSGRKKEIKGKTKTIFFHRRARKFKSLNRCWDFLPESFFFGNSRELAYGR